MQRQAAVYREMTDEELVAQRNNLKEDMFSMRYQMTTGQIENTNVLRQAKKNIARINTILRERQIQKEQVK